jgi:putative SOS response-associated peptidase YedK
VCGRYASTKRDVDLIEESGAEQAVGPELPPSWNVAPTQDARVVLERLDRARPTAPPVRRLQTLRWGLIPSWATDRRVGHRMINARIETVRSRPAYRTALGHRRCLVPADGYFEWQRLPDGSVAPQFLHGGGATLWFAGLYEGWRDPAAAPGHEAAVLRTFTLLTTTATDALGHIHDRSPVILTRELWGAWLDPTLTSAEAALAVAQAAPPPALAAYQVSAAVGDHRNNGPQLVERVAASSPPVAAASSVRRDLPLL